MAQSTRDGRERLSPPRRLLKLITNNWWLKLLALIFAFVLWGYVLSETNPRREIAISDCTIEIRGAESLIERNLTLVSAAASSGTARVRLTVPHKDLKRVNKAYISVVADVSLIGSEGEHRIALKATTPAGEVVSITPDYVDVKIEHMEERLIPVQLTLNGNVPSGYWQGEGLVSPGFIDIKGAKSEVSKISAAKVEIEMSNRTKSFSGALGIRFVDESGEIVNALSVNSSAASVMVEAPVYPCKEVEIDASGAVADREALGVNYILGVVSCNPGRVTVAAPKEVLDSLNSLTLQPVSIAGATSDLTLPVNIAVPEGVVYISQSKAILSAEISEAEKAALFSNIPIFAYSAVANDESRAIAAAQVMVEGRVSEVDALTRGDILLYVDTAGLESGTHLVEVKLRFKNGANLSAEVFPEKVEVTVEAPS